MADARLTFDILATDRASGPISRVGKAAERSSKQSSGLGHAVKTMATAFGGLYVVDKVGEFLKHSTEAAIDDQAAQRKLATALHNTTGATSEQIKGVGDWLSKTSEMYGVSKDELMPAFQRLAESTGSVTKAQKEMGIALDVSAGTGKNLNVVSAALMKANNGTTASLARLGLKTKDAEGHTLSLKDALAKMADTFHGQAEARANSFEGQVDRLKTTFHEFQVQVGEALIPILTKLSGWMLSTGIPAFEKTGEWIKKNGEWLKPLAAIVLSMVAAWKVYEKVALAVEAVQKAMTVAQLALDGAMDANPIGIIVVAIAALAAGLIYAYKHSETFRNIVNAAFHAVAAAAGLMWTLIKGYFKFIIDTWLNVAGAIVNGAAKAFGWVPGLGPKLKAAASWFNDFKNSVNDKLNGIHDKTVHVTANVSGIPAVQGLIDSISKVHNKDVTVTAHGVQKGGIGTLLGAHHASGGRVQAGRLYPINEMGLEGFIPSSNGRVLPATQMNNSGAAQDIVININVDGALDPTSTAKQIQQLLVKLKRTNGGIDLGIA